MSKRGKKDEPECIWVHCRLLIIKEFKGKGVKYKIRDINSQALVWVPGFLVDHIVPLIGDERLMLINKDYYQVSQLHEVSRKLRASLRDQAKEMQAA